MLEKYPSKLFRGIIMATFPEYRKRQVIVKITSSTELLGLNWSGGTKRVYHACTINGQPIVEKVAMDLHHPMNNPFEGKRVEIPEGVVLVEGGWFCGKDATLIVYVNPANAPKFLK